MTRTQPSRSGNQSFSRARVRARRSAVTLVALLVAGELAGCAGIANELCTTPQTRMLFGDARASLAALIANVKQV